MDEKVKNPAAGLGNEPYENDFRPGLDVPSAYARSLMPAKVRSLLEKRAAKPFRRAVA